VDFQSLSAHIAYREVVGDPAPFDDFTEIKGVLWNMDSGTWSLP